MDGHNKQPQSSQAEQQHDSSTPALHGEVQSSTPPTAPGTAILTDKRLTRQSDDEQVEDDEGEAVDPKLEMPNFDWDSLEQRYHDKMMQQGEKERELYNEFTELVEYFTVWANTTHNHEIDRSYKRLKTRMHHVQHSEHELEKKRLHYIKVVNAFESALRLLND